MNSSEDRKAPERQMRDAGPKQQGKTQPGEMQLEKNNLGCRAENGIVVCNDMATKHR